MEHTKHLWRAVLILLVLSLGYLLGRGFLVPATFGEYGQFRGANLAEQINVRVPNHGNGPESCAPCHAERVKEIAKTPHRVINCETCHGPLRTHVDYPNIEAFMKNPGQFKRTAPMEIHTAQELCVRCHDAQPAKPKGFPTVEVVQHLKEMDVEPGPNVCMECHDPHDPKI